ncbi:hypothetical protein BH11BAC3_BH11BAC3_03440 [soil metagenome]
MGVTVATVYLVQRANSSDRKILHLSFLALLLGLVLEFRRISEKWTTVLWTAFGAFVLSFLSFMKGKSEKVYNFEEHLESWPYFFLGAFIIIAMAVQYTKVTKKLTEGITLLLTIAINYWIIANHYWSSDYIVVKILIILNFIFSTFSVYNALSYKTLGKGSRLALSIWSSIIILILSIDNFLKIYKYRDIEHLPTLSESSFIFLQFFLLGVSSIYIAQNITMIGAYIPGKRYMESIREINDVHLKRFSNQQVHIVDAIIVIIISLTGFVLNYLFQFVPTNFMIWTMITVTPLLLYFTHKIIS